MPTIQSIKIQPASFRLLTPFITAAGEKSITRNIQVRVILSDGTPGLGEASTSLAMPEVTPEVMERVLNALAPVVRNSDISDYRALIQTCWEKQPYHSPPVAALECALLDAYTRWKGQPLYKFLGGRETTVETDLTLSVGGPARLATAAKRAWRRGFRRFKIKLAGDSPKEDAQRVAAVHKAVPKAALVADGNQGMNLSKARKFIRWLERWEIPLTFLEQPVPKYDLRSMRLLRLDCPFPLFADEAVLTPADAAKVFQSGAADGINVKIAKSGIIGALDIIQVARTAKKRLAIGCMEESKAGLAASVHLACGTGAFEWVDLDSVLLLEKSPLNGGFDISGPILSVGRIRRGIGIV